MKRYVALILLLCVLLSGCFGRKATVEGLNELGNDNPGDVVITPDSDTAEASGSAPGEESSVDSAASESVAESTASAAAFGGSEETSAPESVSEPVSFGGAKGTSAPQTTSAAENSAAESTASSGWETSDATGYAKEFGTLINDLRTGNGLSSLDYVTDLEDPAFARLTETEQSFSHTRPDGRNCYTVMDDYSLSYQAFGENLALNYSTAQDVFDAWMSSPGHYANMVRADFTGYCLITGSAGGSQYWVLLLIA